MKGQKENRQSKKGTAERSSTRSSSPKPEAPKGSRYSKDVGLVFVQLAQARSHLAKAQLG